MSNGLESRNTTKKKNNAHNTNETGTRLVKWSESGSSMQHHNEEENTNEIATGPLVQCCQANVRVIQFVKASRHQRCLNTFKTMD